MGEKTVDCKTFQKIIVLIDQVCDKIEELDDMVSELNKMLANIDSPKIKLDQIDDMIEELLEKRDRIIAEAFEEGCLEWVAR